MGLKRIKALYIFTFDEEDNNPNNQIPTFFTRYDKKPDNIKRQ
jgi:hypothetical protein